MIPTQYHYGIYALAGRGYDVWIVRNNFMQNQWYRINVNERTITLINTPIEEVQQFLDDRVQKEFAGVSRFDKL